MYIVQVYLSEKVGAFANGPDHVEKGVAILRACRLRELNMVVGGIQRWSNQLRHACINYDVAETLVNAEILAV